jgi:DNA-binding CsgD family transcriptional regulator
VADLVASLDWYWTDGHFLREGYRLLSSVVDDPAVAQNPEVELKTLRVAAMLADHLDDVPRLLPLINRAIDRMRASGQDREIAELLHLASGALINQEQMNAARAKTLETIREAERVGSIWFIAAAEMNLSLIETLEGDYLKARAAAERAAHNFELCGDTDNVPSAINAVAYTWLFEGEFAKAQAAYQDVLVRQADHLDDAYFFQHVCWGVAAVSAKTGRYELAARITGMAIAESKRSQITLRTPLLMAYESIVADARRMLGDEHYERLVEAGHALSKADAVAEIAALAEPPVPTDRSKRPAPFNQLSNREFEVLLHLMAGRTDPEIANELFLSPRTVSQHVSSILNKLGVSSRTAAASMAASANIR